MCLFSIRVVFQVWRKRLHHLVTPELQTALEACIAALEVHHYK